jgi:hypothetical protein
MVRQIALLTFSTFIKLGMNLDEPPISAAWECAFRVWSLAAAASVAIGNCARWRFFGCPHPRSTLSKKGMYVCKYTYIYIYIPIISHISFNIYSHMYINIGSDPPDMFLDLRSSMCSAKFFPHDLPRSRLPAGLPGACSLSIWDSQLQGGITFPTHWQIV